MLTSTQVFKKEQKCVYMQKKKKSSQCDHQTPFKADPCSGSQASGLDPVKVEQQLQHLSKAILYTSGIQML